MIYITSSGRQNFLYARKVTKTGRLGKVTFYGTTMKELKATRHDARQDHAEEARRSSRGQLRLSSSVEVETLPLGREGGRVVGYRVM